MKIAIVGRSVAGNGSWWVRRRWKSRGRRPTQNSTPTPNESQARSTEPMAGAASGVMTLPTTGMNQAGVTCPARMSVRPNQAESTATVAARWPRAPIHHSTEATPGVISESAVARTRMAMVTVGAKAIRTGWRSSARAASTCRTHLAAYSVPMTRKARVARTRKAWNGHSGTSQTTAARRHARATPPKPMTAEKRVTGRWASRPPGLDDTSAGSVRRRAAEARTMTSSYTPGGICADRDRPRTRAVSRPVRHLTVGFPHAHRPRHRRDRRHRP